MGGLKQRNTILGGRRGALVPGRGGKGYGEESESWQLGVSTRGVRLGQRADGVAPGDTLPSCWTFLQRAPEAPSQPPPDPFHPLDPKGFKHLPS